MVKKDQIEPSTPIGRLWICTRAILRSAEGTCREGVVVLDTDPRITAAPEAFRPLIEQLGR